MQKYFSLTVNACGKCMQLKELIEANALHDKIKLINYHTDEGKKLADKFGIRSAGTIHEYETGLKVNYKDIVG